MNNPDASPPKSDSPAEEARMRDVTEASRIYILPNCFTAGNLFFGFLAIIWCIRGHYTAAPDSILAATYFTQAVFFILAAGLCDLLDGRIARLGGRESLFGKEFDSIADVVSFGMAPALMVFFLILPPTEGQPFFRQLGWLIGFLYLLCAGVRLARFNVITNPYIPGADKQNASKDFLGLPAPAAAGTVASLVLVLVNFELPAFSLFLPPLMVLIAWLMVSGVHYPSFKYIDWHTRMNFQIFILFIVLAAALFLFWKFSFAILFLGYIFHGLFRHFKDLRASSRRSD